MNKAKRSLRQSRNRRILRRIGRILLGAFAVSLILFGLFFWWVRTDEDRRLEEEIRLYEQYYPGLRDREQRIAKVVDYLQIRDNDIYRDIFYSDAPSLEAFLQGDLLAGQDTLPQGDLDRYTGEKAGRLLDKAGEIDARFREITRLLTERSGEALPPMTLPVEDAGYTQIGASTGMRMSPFLKVELFHSGLDILAPQETPVHATATGIVKSVARSRKGLGNIVEIEHEGRYRTRYGHLGDVKVSQGQRVRSGQVIGTVGMSGNSFVPHLHYEVLRDSLTLDPACYLFASVGATDYANMMFLSAHTGQSLD